MAYAIGPIILAIFVLVVLSRSVRVNQEYERAVFFRLGRLGDTKGPGLFLLLPIVDRAVKVDLRTMTVKLETQETIRRDGVAVRVIAVLWFRAVNPALVVTAVRDFSSAIVQAAETGMRDVIGQSDLDQMLKDRVAINRRLLDLLTATAARWGVEIEAV